MIEVSQLSKSYGTMVAVDALSFGVAPGQVLGLVGPNGAGKTTTLRCLCGILTPSSGTIRIAGHDLHMDGPGAKAELAFIPDEPELFDYLTVEEHLRFIGRLYGVADAPARAPVLLEELELTEKRKVLPGELSRGMKQKLAIACGLLHNPKVLILDEPLTGLDPAGIKKMKATITARARDGAAVILSSHLLHLVEELCSTLLVIRRGRCVALGTLDQIVAGRPDLAGQSLEDIFLSLTGQREPRHEQQGGRPGVPPRPQHPQPGRQAGVTGQESRDTPSPCCSASATSISCSFARRNVARSSDGAATCPRTLGDPQRHAGLPHRRRDLAVRPHRRRPRLPPRRGPAPLLRPALSTRTDRLSDGSLPAGPAAERADLDACCCDDSASTLPAPMRFAQCLGGLLGPVLHQLGTALVLAPVPHGGRRIAGLAGQGLATAAVVAIVAGMLLPLYLPARRAREWRMALPDAAMAVASPPISVVLAPFHLIVAPMHGDIDRDWLAAIAVVLGIIALHVAWALLDERGVRGSRRGGFRQAGGPDGRHASAAPRRLKRWPRRAGKAARHWLPLAPAGNPGDRDSVEEHHVLFRGSGARTFVIVVAIGVVVVMSQGMGPAMAQVMAPGPPCPIHVARLDDHADGTAHAAQRFAPGPATALYPEDVPFEGKRLVAAEMLSPTLVLTAFQFLLLAIGYAMIPDAGHTVAEIGLSPGLLVVFLGALLASTGSTRHPERHRPDVSVLGAAGS